MKPWFLIIVVCWVAVVSNVTNISTAIMYGLVSFIFGVVGYFLVGRLGGQWATVISIGAALVGPLLFGLIEPMLPGYEPVEHTVTITLPAEL